MSYATYNDYVSIFGGSKMTACEFMSYVNQASAYIDFVTFNRITEPDCAVIKAVCAISEYMFEAETNSAKQSESVGKYKVDYAVRLKTESEIKKEKYSLALMYLSHTGLMYTGNR